MASLGISGPIWNYMFDTTVTRIGTSIGIAPLNGLSEPKLEPELVLHLAVSPRQDMSPEELLGCIDWIAPGFELVHSIFPSWQFGAADAAAAFGVHGALLVGECLMVPPRLAALRSQLSEFEVRLAGNDGTELKGHASNVLGGPLEALRFLISELERCPQPAPLLPGELITTGTLTAAAVAGAEWTATFEGIPLKPIAVRLA